MDQDDTEATYKVVVNHEEQYSIWVAKRPNPLGWYDAEKSGSKSECLAFIKEVWTDMRPLSLRKKMEESIGELHDSFVDLNRHQTKTRRTDQ